VKPPSVPNLTDSRTPSPLPPDDTNGNSNRSSGDIHGGDVNAVHQQKATLDLLKAQMDQLWEDCHGQMKSMREEIVMLSQSMEELKLDCEALKKGATYYSSRGQSASPGERKIAATGPG